MINWKTRINDLKPCPEAQSWIDGCPPSPALAWRQCPRGEWLLWLASKAGVDRRLVVRAACDCARLALRYVPAGETRPLAAIGAAEAWCTFSSPTAAETAADAAADASAYAADASAYAVSEAADAAASAAASAASAAAYAASAAAYEASAAAYAAPSAAAYAADAAAYEASAAAYDTAAKDRALRRCATLVRVRMGWRDILAALEAVS